MAQAAFDTITEVQRLRDAGIEQAQAEAITRSIHAGVTGGVATKADLLQVKTELEGAIVGVRGELKEEIAGVRTEVAKVRTEVEKVRTEVETIRTLIATGQTAQLRWMIGLAVAMAGVLVAALTLQ